MVREYLHAAQLNMSSSLLMSPFSLAWALEELCNGDKFPNNVGKNICWGVYVIFHSICSVKKIKYSTPLQRPILWVKNLKLKMAQFNMKQTFFVSSGFFYYFSMYQVTSVCFFSSFPFIFITICWGKTYKDPGKKKWDIQQDRSIFLEHCACFHQYTQWLDGCLLLTFIEHISPLLQIKQ